MKKSTVLLCALLLGVVSVGFSLDPAPEHEPHVERPTAGAANPQVSIEDSGFSEVSHPGEVVIAFREWTEGQAREAWFRGIEEQMERDAAAQAVERARRSRVSTPVSGGAGECGALAAELGLDASILWRESRCSRDAVNVTGCGGRGCVGAAQVDEGHTYAVSPWNPNVPGTCYGLELSDPASYAECVSRLPASAWNG